MSIELEAKTEAADGAGGINDALGRMPPDTILSLDGLSGVLHCHPATIRRAIKRRELPPAVRFLGRQSWLAGTITKHFAARLERAKTAADKEAQRLSALAP